MVGSEEDAREGMRVGWEARLAYWLIIAGIYLLVGVLFFYAGKEKIFDGLGAPPGIEKQFQGTFLATIPGTDAAWTIIGILEFAIFVLLAISLVTLEFLPHRRKRFLLVGLALAVFTFSLLAIGQNVTGETSGVAQLYVYAAATVIFMLIVLRLPPYLRRA